MESCLGHPTDLYKTTQDVFVCRLYLHEMGENG